jgi:hypothetical protein
LALDASSLIFSQTLSRTDLSPSSAWSEARAGEAELRGPLTAGDAPAGALTRRATRIERGTARRYFTAGFVGRNS